MCVESVIILPVESDILVAPVVSADIVLELEEAVSVVTVVESVLVPELPLPQAAKAPIANTNNNFFIDSFF